MLLVGGGLGGLVAGAVTYKYGNRAYPYLQRIARQAKSRFGKYLGLLL